MVDRDDCGPIFLDALLWINNNVDPTLALRAMPALAAPPTAEQKADFYSTCMGIAEDDALRSCKAEAAMTLIDERFMGVVIAGMKGKAPAEAEYSAYNTYVAKSNQICKPNY